jgi:PLP dependent protein
LIDQQMHSRFGDHPEQLFRDNLELVEQRIAAACARAGRSRSSVTLLPVTKTVPSGMLRHAAHAGITVMAENKIQEGHQKSLDLGDLGIKWTVVGHLQTNKVGKMLEFASEFQALDSLRLAQLINAELVSVGRSLDVYVQVNTSDEESKYGIRPDQAIDFVEELSRFPALKPRGLMTLAILNGSPENVRSCFRRLRAVRDALTAAHPYCGIEKLSMGMTSDFEIAIEEGADIVRIGQAIFGKRPTKDGHFWPGLLP